MSAMLLFLAIPAAAADRPSLGRVPTAAEIAAWDIDIRPDGLGLPPGRGTVRDGETIWTERCASCHGDFGEGVGRVPAVMGGTGTLADDQPVRTVGSYWPYLSTVFDYVRRAMPYGDARSLTDGDTYALTAYILYLNALVDEDFTLSAGNFTAIRLPNAGGFGADDRLSEPHYAIHGPPCMTSCKEDVRIISHAAERELTPKLSGED